MRTFPNLSSAPMVMHHIYDDFVFNPGKMVSHWEFSCPNKKYWLKLFGQFRKMVRERGPAQWRELDEVYFIRARFMPDGQLVVQRSVRGLTYNDAAAFILQAMNKPGKNPLTAPDD